MKKKIMFLAGIALTVGGLYVNQAHGSENKQIAYDYAVKVACDDAQNLGYNVMRVRQMDMTVDEQIKIIKDSGVDDRTSTLATVMVLKAHEQNVVDSNMVESVSQDFGDQMEAQCLKDMSGKIL